MALRQIIFNQSKLPRKIHRIFTYTLFILLSLVAGQLAAFGQTDPAPILLITDTQAVNPFSAYLAEILRAEGIHSFTQVDIGQVDEDVLADVQLIVLAEMNLDSAQVSLLDEYVQAGGALVAMRPDAQLAPVLGLQLRPGVVENGYIAIDPALPGGDGFPGLTLPFKGAATNYQMLAGTQALADLYVNRSKAIGGNAPAVSRYGRTVAWSYDLAASVVLTRQGFPANAGIERDGIEAIRTFDLFYKADDAQGPAQNDVDPQRVEVPYADLQMRFFARVIADLLAETMPLPQLWYHSAASRTTLVLTSDSHGNSPTYERYYELLIDAVEAYDAAITIMCRAMAFQIRQPWMPGGITVTRLPSIPTAPAAMMIFPISQPGINAFWMNSVAAVMVRLRKPFAPIRSNGRHGRRRPKSLLSTLGPTTAPF